MKKLMLSLIIILPLLASCTKEKSPIYSSSLFGEWSWISSCGGIAGICYTPTSTTQRIELVFTSDYILNTYVNDTLYSSTRFQTYILPPADLPGTPNVIRYNSSYQVTFSIVHDTLFLNDFCCDGFNSIYKRKK